MQVGADVNSEIRSTGQSVLTDEVRWCDLEIVEVLIDAGADVNRLSVNAKISSIQAAVAMRWQC